MAKSYTERLEDQNEELQAELDKARHYIGENWKIHEKFIRALARDIFHNEFDGMYKSPQDIHDMIWKTWGEIRKEVENESKV